MCPQGIFALIAASRQAISTAAPPVGSHKRTKAKSRYNALTARRRARRRWRAVLCRPPHSRDGRDSHEVSDRSSQPQRVSLETHRHWARLLRSWGPPSLPEFEQKLVRWNKERILLHYPADDHDRVRPHHVHDHAGTELRQIIGADDRIVIFGNHV